MYGSVEWIETLSPDSLVVEVFKTNVRSKRMANIIVADLARVCPGAKINFDLDDCDKILRIECNQLIPTDVIDIINRRGLKCEVLE